MKKRIAVFANGWSDEYVQKILGGIRNAAKISGADVYVFTLYSSSAKLEPLEEDNIGEENIFQLPDLKQFDGVIAMTNTCASDYEIQMVQNKVHEAGIPGVSLEWPLEGLDFFGADNYTGMYEVAEHLITVHHLKKIMFISGPEDNDESNTRLQAVKDAMAKHGLSIGEKDVICGYYSHYLVGKLLNEWLDAGNELPEAFVCANDAMAMAASAVLQRRGYRVPEDVAVTGFDCLESARHSKPSITSVGRGWDELGYHCMEHLMKKIAGDAVPKEVLVPSAMVVGESCGCHPESSEIDEVKREAAYEEIMGNVVFNNHFRDIYKVIRKAKNRDLAKNAIENVFADDSKFEGDNFAVCLNDDFFASAYEGKTLRTEGFSEQVETLCCFKDGVPNPTQRFEYKKLLPPIYEEREESTCYIFAPLHIEAESFGYVCFIDNLQVFKNYDLYNWTQYLNQHLEQIRQNIRMESMNARLTELSVRDALTGVYNRTGYEIKALPYLQKCKAEGKNAVMMIADINRMKVINDKYGHLQGDLAIQIVAESISNAVPVEWVVVRYGGDEFLVVGDCESQLKAEEIKRKVLEEVRRTGIREKVQFPLSVSLGAVWMSEGEQLDLEECFKRADDAMYVMKKKAHETQAGV